MHLVKQPIEIDSIWLSDDQIERIGGASILVRFSLAEKRVLKKKKKIRPSVWAERHRHLPKDAAVPGRGKNSTIPYAAGILDASFFPSVQEIVVCAAPQTAKSEINYTCLGYAVDRKPGNALVVFPDENTAIGPARFTISAVCTGAGSCRPWENRPWPLPMLSQTANIIPDQRSRSRMLALSQPGHPGLGPSDDRGGPQRKRNMGESP